MTNTNDYIYIVISQTGTVLSRLLKLITKADYNHVSLGLTDDLENMYSFGRLHPYNPIWGGFVNESPNRGTFKRFYNTKVIVLSLKVSSNTYKNISETIQYISDNRRKYHYNYFGVFFGAFKHVHKASNSYYCSEFVKEILVKNNIEGADSLSAIVQPIHFLDIPNTNIFYRGKLKDYRLFYENILSRTTVKG